MTTITHRCVVSAPAIHVQESGDAAISELIHAAARVDAKDTFCACISPPQRTDLGDAVDGRVAFGFKAEIVPDCNHHDFSFDIVIDDDAQIIEDTVLADTLCDVDLFTIISSLRVDEADPFTFANGDAG
ncbi:hypothetical protein A3709_19955 [Halioglobus sp. HI00S01]|uniref:hypothetical protein n=1 Tax=Halioglobus sp. HI00S01 TaxID=1822214 RepID=UPI0007C2D229|nr:hypothetical protein [Halioglobus sp. HI00S01]KZX57900.1 hypothetical protein A3709_19955 [Halioglobus sp. HI00S01]